LQKYRLQRKRPFSSLKDTFNRPLSPDTLTFPYSSSDEEDVFVSAGIISSKDKPQRRRSKRRRRSRANKPATQKSHKKKGKSDKLEKSNEKEETRHQEEEVIVSSITEANHLPSAVLRRIIRPRLEKAKQFLIPLHLHFSSSATATTPLPIRGRDKVALSCASTPVLPTRLDDMFMDVPTPMMSEDWRFRPDRRHRRSHSEQPRAWREPSPALWTLAEE
jgi:hypothetical protein